MNYTESESYYSQLQDQSIGSLIEGMNQEDRKVADAVQKALPQIEQLITHVVKGLKQDGRLFYIGAGTSGRLGVLDASECPPTFGVSPQLVVGIIAGGDTALRNAVEFAEDNTAQARKDLQPLQLNNRDSIIGISASGSAPYVIEAMQYANQKGALTGCITSNLKSALSEAVRFPVEVIVGAEFVTGSTRLKSGTAQKMVLNMISTASMIQLGKVQGNQMVDMQIANHKLINRGAAMVAHETGLPLEDAKELLLKKKNVREAIDFFKKS